MSSCSPILLEGITTDKFATLIATAQAQGLSISGPSGNTTYQGMEFTWAYDEAAQTLTLHCTSKPIFIPCSMIESRIRALIS
jgi:hypothetical protein